MKKKNLIVKKLKTHLIMKTNLFKGLKNFLFLPLFILVMFTSCQNEESDVTDTNTEESFEADSPLAQYILSTTSYDGSFDNIIDSANCISVNLPVTVVVNGITLTIESIDDYDLIEDIFDEFDDDENEIEIQFPITIILNDYSQVVIENYDQLFAFVEECFGENEEDDDIECIDFQYPISISIFDANFDLIETIEINDDEELYEFIDELEGGVLASINFPVNMVLADGSIIEVNNNDELQAAIEEAEDACDEDDDNDWNDDDDEDCSEEEIELALKECIWNIVAYNGDDNFAHYDLDFDPNYGFTVSENGNIVHDGTWSVSQDGDDFFIDLETSWQDLNANWEVVDCDEDRFELVNGDVEIVIEQECEDDLDCSAQEIASNLMECTWYSGTSLLSNDFNGPYVFSEDGVVTVSTPNGNPITGTWEVALGNTGVFLILDLPGDYEAISLYWRVVECDDDRLEFVSDEEELVLEQDCNNPFECYSNTEMVNCDDDVIDGFTEFDLNYAYPNCVEDNMETTFYMSIEDAESQVNPLSSPYTNVSNPQTIYARVQLAGTNTYEVFEVELYVEDCSEEGCTEEQVDAYLMECHWVAVSYNGDDQLLGYNIFFNENMDLVIEGNGGTFNGTWSTAGNPANGVFLTIEQLPADLQDLIGQWQVVECTETQIILHDDNNVEIVLERDCNYSGCNEDQVNNFLLECTWNVVNYNNSDDLIIFDLNFNNDGTMTITGDGQTITSMWSTSTTDDGVWIEFSDVNAGNIQAITGNWLVVECVEEELMLEMENAYLLIARTCP